MKQAKLLRNFPFAVAFAFCGVGVMGQDVKKVQLTGTIYDASARWGLQGVSVLGSSGAGTTTDSLGHYRIKLPVGDSIYFSYLGRGTARVPVKDIPEGFPFDMSLDVAIDSLPTVFVQSHDYRTDSLENRREYKKAFEFGYSYLEKMNVGPGGLGLGMGLNLDVLLNRKKVRRMEALQKRLEEEEKDKYIDHRWNRALLRRVTGLEPPALDSFMRQYRPTKEFIQSCATDYEFYHYISEWGKYFAEDWKGANKK